MFDPKESKEPANEVNENVNAFTHWANTYIDAIFADFQPIAAESIAQWARAGYLPYKDRIIYRSNADRPQYRYTFGNEAFLAMNDALDRLRVRLKNTKITPRHVGHELRKLQFERNKEAARKAAAAQPSVELNEETEPLDDLTPITTDLPVFHGAIANSCVIRMDGVQYFQFDGELYMGVRIADKETTRKIRDRYRNSIGVAVVSRVTHVPAND